MLTTQVSTGKPQAKEGKGVNLLVYVTGNGYGDSATTPLCLGVWK